TPAPAPEDDPDVGDKEDAPADMTADRLVELAAEAKQMSPRLILSAAQAKAEQSGATLEAVLREWAGDSALSRQDEAEMHKAPQPTPAPPASAPAASMPPAGDDSESSVPGATTTDHLVQLAAEARRMPPGLILKSAKARSDHSGTPLEDVLADWAGVDLDDLEARAPASVPADVPEASPAAPPAPPVAPVAAATALTMDQLLEKVADVKGMPAPLAKRSAEARSKKTGEPVEAVLAEWAGIDAGLVTAAPAEPAAPTPASVEEAAAQVSPQEPAGGDVEIIDAEPPDTSGVTETDDEPAPKRGGYPIWLAAAFIVIPLLAVAYILVSPNGPDCGSGGLLGIDPVTGEATNCDGSEYGIVTVDNFAAGGALYQQCVACHSDDGSGGVGPAFNGGAILTTFPAGSCTDHIGWVSAGTTGWPEPTYGATDKPVGGGGVMPGFGTSLTEEQIAQVALYERVAFGGEDLVAAEIDCGLGEADDTATEAADS
ncbi:MAG: hypothetical protein U9Q71_06195, partial [Pseudomonadota bacterium]|nr:hypothetical protein [Pseudomonadota bacterium]